MNSNRIRPLPSDTAESVRAGQIIGSLSRAVEELVYNSAEHGKASTVRITLGRRRCNNDETFVMHVQDDGIGIDPNALKKYIGTVHCSSKYPSNSYGSNRHKMLKFSDTSQSKSTTENRSNKISRITEGRGESLKALSSLSIQLQIVTKCSSTCSQRKAHNDKSLQKKSRHNISSNEKAIVKSEKIIRDGITESFSSIINNDASCSNKSLFSFYDGIIQDKNRSKENIEHQTQPNTTGTTVTIWGLFHRHAVRRRQYNLSLNQNASAIEKSNFSHVRSCIRIMALAHPHIEFILENGKTGSIIASWPVASSQHLLNIKNTQEKSPTLASNISALRTRLKQICGEGDVITKKSCIIPIIYKESYAIDISLQKQHKKTNDWTANGVLFCPTHLSNMKRSKQYENIFINRRIPLHASSFCTIIQDTVSSYSLLKGSNFYAYFLIHIETPQDEVDSIVNESHSEVTVLDRQRMENFIQKAIQRSLANNKKVGVQINHFSKPLDCFESTSASSTKSSPSKCSRLKTMNSNAQKSQSTRIISGEKIVSNAKEISNKLSRDANKLIEKAAAPCSPFSDAFMNGSSMFDTTSELKSSFEDAFIATSSIDIAQKNNSNNEIELENEGNKMWTRQRLRAPDIPLLSKLSSIKPELKFQKGISLTKEMISNAKVIGQLDAKFIVIKADKFICIVDQHAAHERVQLERLENKILSNMFTPGLKISEEDDVDIEPIIIDGEKDKYWKPEEFELKTETLSPVQIVNLSPTDKIIITQMESILKKWKFSFNFTNNNNNNESKLVLNGAPKVCGKTASSDDFINFVHELESREVDAELCKPAFISRVLASHACRYGIMFGDVLTWNQCNDLIKAFSKCKLPFICAHGRPSVVPLFDTEGL